MEDKLVVSVAFIVGRVCADGCCRCRWVVAIREATIPGKHWVAIVWVVWVASVWVAAIPYLIVVWVVLVLLSIAVKNS